MSEGLTSTTAEPSPTASARATAEVAAQALLDDARRRSRKTGGGTLANRVRTSMLVVVSAVLLCVTLVANLAEYFEATEERRDYAQTMARLLAANSEAALIFDDVEGAREALEPLRTERSIISAHVHRSDGRSMASYGEAATAVGQHAHDLTAGSAVFEQRIDTLTVMVPVHDGDSMLGYVHLAVSMRPAYEGMMESSILMALLALAVFIASIPVARRIGTRIVAPLGQLSVTMSDIALRSDFSTRASRVHDDEVGDLVDHFNALLGQLQDRDAILMSRQIQLESEVDARTHELLESNESLRAAVVEIVEARDAAQQASDAKSQVLANMSHEIRSPLNGVIGMAELLRNTSLDDRQTHFCRTIMTSSTALLGVLNDVLDLS